MRSQLSTKHAIQQGVPTLDPSGAARAYLAAMCLKLPARHANQQGVHAMDASDVAHGAHAAGRSQRPTGHTSQHGVPIPGPNGVIPDVTGIQSPVPAGHTIQKCVPIMATNGMVGGYQAIMRLWLPNGHTAHQGVITTMNPTAWPTHRMQLCNCNCQRLVQLGDAGPP